jgi:hypothetical protein
MAPVETLLPSFCLESERAQAAAGYEGFKCSGLAALLRLSGDGHVAQRNLNRLTSADLIAEVN